MPEIDIAHTFSLTIGGTEVWSKVNTGSLVFTENEGGQIDTLVFELTDVTDVLEVTAWQEVIWTLDGSDTAFGGYVVTPKPRLGANGAYRIWTVTCESYVSRLARATIVRKTYVRQYAAGILGDLFDLALDPEGTPPNQTEFNTTTHCAISPGIDLFVTDGEKLGKVLDRLATVVTDLAGSTWTWRIDAAKAVWFGPMSSDAAPFSIARIASANWSTSFPPLQDPDNSVDATDIRNRITVRGGIKPSAHTTETFSGDGSTPIFALAHKPVRTIVRVTVGGVLQSHGVDWYDTFGGGYDVLVNYSAGTLRWPDVSPPAVGTNNISVTYVYNDVVYAQASDAASQAQYGLWFDYEVNESTITTDAAATELANALLTEYAYGVSTGTLEVARWGIRGGQRLQVEFSPLGFTGYYAVRQVVTTLTGPESVSCRVSFGGHTAKLSSYVGGGSSGTGTGSSAYSQPTVPAINGEVENLYVNEWLASIDRATTFNSMTDYGTATGLVLGYDPSTQKGQLLGLNAGALQAYFDSDGSIKAGAGDVVLDADGVKITSGAGNTNALKWVNVAGVTKFSIYATQPTPPDINFDATLYAEAGSLGLLALSGLNLVTTAGDIGITSSGALQFVVGSGIVDFNALRLTEVADAAADTDALNRQTGDARYVPIPGSAARGDILYRNATVWTRLAAGTSGYYLKTQGAGADPTWADDTVFLLATGARTGASAQAQTFTNGIIGPSWKPAADSTTALQMQNAAGTSILNVNTTNARVGIGTSPSTLFHALLTDAGTDAIVNVATLGHDTSGTAAAGFGLGLALNLESSTTAAQSAALISTLWYEATHATRKADLVLSAYDTAAREGLRIRGAGDAAAIGFFGVDPASRIDYVTAAETENTVTDPGDSPADADALRDDLVANTIPSIKSAIDALAEKINFTFTTLETFGLLRQTTWFNVGGVSPLAAYEPIGAANYAASLVNKALPSTRDAAEGTAPSWTSAGWYFDAASSQYLIGPSVDSDQTITILIRIASGGTGYMTGVGGAASGNRAYIKPDSTLVTWRVNGSTNKTPAFTDGVLALTTTADGGIGYRGGVSDGAVGSAWNGAGSGTTSIIGSTYGLFGYWTGYVLAWAIYTNTLTPEQVLAISTAMAELTA